MTIMNADAISPEGGDAPFTEEELATVRRLCSVARDMGLSAKLAVKIAKEYDSPEVIIEAMGTAISDILASTDRGTEPQEILGAALSLELVAPLLRDILPDDFVPSADMIDRCKSMFFHKHRAGTAS